jgi:hypothetical protein
MVIPAKCSVRLRQACMGGATPTKISIGANLPPRQASASLTTLGALTLT